MSKNARIQNTGNTEKFNYTKWGFLLSTSIALFTLIAGVTVPEIRRLIGLESKTGVVQKQDVELITLTETGEPLGGVRIQVISQGAPEFTWTGDTGFAKVKIPSKGDVIVNLTKAGYPTQNLPINLENDQSTTRTIRLTQSGKPEVKSLVSSSPAAPVPNPSITTPPTETNSTPPASSTDLSQKTAGNSESDYVKEFDGFIFNFQDCRLGDKVIKCNFLITNKTRERSFKIRADYNRVIFNDGNEYYGRYVQIGGQNGFEVMTSLPQNVSLKGTLTFNKITTDTNKISLFKIKFSTENEEGEYIRKESEFRNITISN